jgi:hypothetical protein
MLHLLVLSGCPTRIFELADPQEEITNRSNIGARPPLILIYDKKYKNIHIKGE